MSAGNDEVISVRCECLRIKVVEGNRRLLALADVRIDIGGFVIEVNSVRVEREPSGVSVRLPIDREGRAFVIVADDIRQPLADVILAAGLETGVLRELGGATG